MENGPTFDPEILRPETPIADLTPDSLLEITVWDLFEPNKPHTFPVRIAANSTVELPMLEPVSTEKLSLRQIEEAIAQNYRDNDLLKKPRVLVRSLDPTSVRVAVTGAVNRSGTVDLPRGEASVFSALMASGGLKKNAGTHIGLSRRVIDSPLSSTSTTAAKPVQQMSDTPTDPLVQRVNSLEPITVAMAEPEPAKPVGDTTWYDLTKDADRKALQTLTLRAGDAIIFKMMQPPVRIGGDVARPGPYTLPLDGSLDVWQTLELAGGPDKPEQSFQVVLMKPAAEGRGPQRWSRTVNSWSEHPPASPAVQPGDAIHLEAISGKVLQQAVQHLWN